MSELGLPLDVLLINPLLSYLDLLAKWNGVYNLTAIRDPNEMLTQHLMDCLAIIQPFQTRLPKATSLADVGAGAGLPSVVLAIAIPHLQVTAIDAVSKKTAFIQQVATTLGLKNLQVKHGRVEKMNQRFDVVCSRAFASLLDFVTQTSQLLDEQGIWMAMKGKTPLYEIEQLPQNIQIESIEPLHVPNLDAQRCLVWLKKCELCN